jgi:hypothetical protein
MKFLKILFTTVIIIALAGCKKDSPIAPAAPDTQLYVSKINLTGKDRLPSVVEMHWTGTDESGFVTGYELSFDQVNWIPTTKTDSTFHFSLESGTLTKDIQLFVRAIDNHGLKDPTPAHVTIPIQNSAPTVSLNSSTFAKDTAYALFSFEWTAHDKDGDATIDSVFVKVNNGSWYYISASSSFATIIPDNVKGSGKMQGSVYKDLAATKLNNKIDGLVLNGTNRLYIKVRDIADAFSDIDSSSTFYLKGQKNDLLVINASGVTPNPSEVFIPALNAIGVEYDYVDFFRDNQKYLPAYWNPTFTKYISLYNKVFIYTDEQTLPNGKLVLEAASASLATYLNNGGKLLVSSYFPSSQANTTTVRDFSPVDSFATNKASAQARISTDSALIPDPTYAQGYKPLKISSFIVGASPFYPKDAQVMYRAQLSKVGGWHGPNVVIARTLNAQGHTNEVFSSVDLSSADADDNALKDFFSKVLLNEFNW